MQRRASILESRKLCLPTNAHCLACLTNSVDSCSICIEGYYLHNGSCHSTCPTNTYKYQYQRVCLQSTIPNCLEEATQQFYWQFTKSDLNKNADGLFYFLKINFQVSSLVNDPIGSIFIYLQRQSRRTHISPRSVNIASSQQICKLCRPGHGLSPSGGCLPCQSPCL